VQNFWQKRPHPGGTRERRGEPNEGGGNNGKTRTIGTLTQDAKEKKKTVTAAITSKGEKKKHLLTHLASVWGRAVVIGEAKSSWN